MTGCGNQPGDFDRFYRYICLMPILISIRFFVGFALHFEYRDYGHTERFDEILRTLRPVLQDRYSHRIKTNEQEMLNIGCVLFQGE